jgi:transcriptional regulator of met regulon
MDIHRYLSYIYLYLPIGIYRHKHQMAMKKIMLALPEEMLKVLEKERKERYLETIPETVRVILSEYLRKG